MIDIQTKEFDETLKSVISHFQNYPEMLPFIGSRWSQSKKVLLIGESHYLPYGEIKIATGRNYYEDWYTLNSSGLEANYQNYFTTRNNIFQVEEKRHAKPLAFYFNLKGAIQEVEYFRMMPSVFDHFAFYNYFQRPANVQEVDNENRSIEPTSVDKEMAFETLLKIKDVIRPASIIFVSKKSFHAFEEVCNHRNLSLDLKIDFVPHAGRPWWNRESEVYGNRTGKQKFIDLLRDCY